MGICVSGSARIRMREGAELLVEAGQFYQVPPGHDAWVVGDEPWITIDWIETGQVPAYQARHIAKATRHLSAEHAGIVDHRIAPIRWAIRRMRASDLARRSEPSLSRSR